MAVASPVGRTGNAGGGWLGEAVSFEQSLFHPLHVDPGTLEWMAQERRKLEAHLPKDTKRIVVQTTGIGESVDDLLQNQAEIFADRFGTPDPIHVTGNTKQMYRRIMENPPRFPVYVAEFFDPYSLGDDFSVGLAGTSRMDLDAGVYDPDAQNKKMLMWGLIGVVHGVMQPKLGFIQGSEAGIQELGSRTLSLESYFQKNIYLTDLDKRCLGARFAEMMLKAANSHIKPRGGCFDQNIRIVPGGDRKDDRVILRNVVFQAVDSPQESMNFMLSKMGPSSLHFLQAKSCFGIAMQQGFMDKIDESGLLDVEVFRSLLKREPEAYFRLPTVVRNYVEGKMKSDLPPTM